eukprot:5925444-Amphidinium_carterae.1
MMSLDGIIPDGPHMAKYSHVELHQVHPHYLASGLAFLLLWHSHRYASTMNRLCRLHLKGTGCCIQSHAFGEERASDTSDLLQQDPNCKQTNS